MIYIRSIPSMEDIPDDLLPEFLKGKHVMRHNRGIWNAIWPDMSVESTFMRYGHQAGGLRGLTLKPSAVTRWALCWHTYSQLGWSACNERQANQQDNHTSQRRGITSDASYSLSTSKLHRSACHKRRPTWTTECRDSFMNSTKKSIKLDGKPLYETELIYTRVICLHQYRDIDITYALSYEFSAVPATLFMMRVVQCVINRRQSWIRNSKLKNEVGSKEYRMQSSSMDMSCCGQCIGPQVTPLKTT